MLSTMGYIPLTSANCCRFPEFNSPFQVGTLGALGVGEASLKGEIIYKRIKERKHE